jgi:REP element-mobilizing transposase RayT
MILAYHIIMTAYGFWLPNDPRGSWSDFVASWELLRYGKATKTNERRSLARDPHDVQLRLAAKRALKYPPVLFDAEQIQSIARGFARAAEESGYDIYECAILKDHAHVVLGRTARHIHQVIGHLKARATQQLLADEIHPLREYMNPGAKTLTIWSEGPWKVFIDNLEHLENAIRYVKRNPVREGLPEQVWWFVKPCRLLE